MILSPLLKINRSSGSMAGADTGMEVSYWMQSIKPINGNLPESLWITCTDKIALFS
jgi:hypothetical protein